MPPRLVCLGIVVCWLATTSWLVMREVVPRYRAGEAPPFSIDLIDEVGASTSSWSIHYQNKRIGNGLSWVDRRRDRTFVLANELKFEKLDVAGALQVRKANSSIHVNADGEFLGFHLLFRLRFFQDDAKARTEYHEVDVAVAAELETDGLLHFKVESPWGSLPKEFTPAPAELPIKGKILNTMHLINKINGLEPGKTWRLEVLDDPTPLAFGQKIKTKEVLATVHEDVLDWHGNAIDCFRIDYQDPGDAILASTWVRQLDGLVLQQAAAFQGRKLVSIRENR